MTPIHFILALVVVLIWGINFIFIKFALGEIPPLFLCAIRFLLASIPAIFFIRLPVVAFKKIALYGFFTFVLQFSLLFIGMQAGMTPGMASLIMQVQVFFSIFFAALFLEEKPFSWQLIGALISFCGIGLVGMHLDRNISFVGFLCILAAAASWGVGNLITKKIVNLSMMTLVVWGSFMAAIPMLLLSYLIEGPQRMVESYHHLTWVGMSAVLYIVYASTWIGYGLWNLLLSRYPVGTVVPFTLLVPIIGMISSILVLGEPFQHWKLMAGILVISGLCINLIGTKFFMRKAQTSYPHPEVGTSSLYLNK